MNNDPTTEPPAEDAEAKAEVGTAIDLAEAQGALNEVQAQILEHVTMLDDLTAKVDAKKAEMAALKAPAAEVVPDGVIINAERTSITVRTTVASGDDLFSLFDVLAGYGRELFGNHNGLYVEKVG